MFYYTDPDVSKKKVILVFQQHISKCFVLLFLAKRAFTIIFLRQYFSALLKAREFATGSHHHPSQMFAGQG
jgi:hypothetical protein